MIRQPEHDSTAADDLGAVTPEGRRAAVLRCLRDRDGPVALDELAAALVERAAYQPGSRPGDVVTEGRVRTRLHHVDLPKLDDIGLLDYDPEARLAVEPAASGRNHGP